MWALDLLPQPSILSPVATNPHRQTIVADFGPTFVHKSGATRQPTNGSNPK